MVDRPKSRQLVHVASELNYWLRFFLEYENTSALTVCKIGYHLHCPLH